MKKNLVTRALATTFAAGVAALALATPAHATIPSPGNDGGTTGTTPAAPVAAPISAPDAGWGQLALGAGAGIAVSGLGAAVVVAARRRQPQPA